MESQYNYGTRADQIHPFFKKKREWSKIKDKIMGDYIACYLKTVQNIRRPIIIVDAFAGPGKFGDGTDGSPLITCNNICNAPSKGVGLACLFADTHPAHRLALENNLKPHITSGIAEKPFADFTEVLTRALQVGKGSTLFFYLDPYGIKDLEFEVVKQICERDVKQSTEVLINFSFKTFMRMSGNWSFSDSSKKISEKVKKSKIDTVNKVMGGDYWLDIINEPSLNKFKKEDAIVNAYMANIRKFFHHTVSIPVKEMETNEKGPVDDLAKYHLIFGTRSSRAVVYMNDVAMNALEPYFKKFNEGLLFSMIPERYEAASKDEIKSAIIEIVSSGALKRKDIYERVIPKYFFQYRTKDYRAFIEDLVFSEKRLFADPRTMKVKSKLNDDTLISVTPWMLR